MKKIFLTIALAGLMFSCAKDELGGVNPVDQPNAEESQLELYDGEIVLGEPKRDPYTVETMRRAFRNLPQEVRGAMSESDIRPTHLYVKFKPKNNDELDFMERDSTINFFPFPLDYEFEKPGTYYRDPAVPEGQPTYYYASVPVGHALPEGIDNEMLKELYIPERPVTRAVNSEFAKAITDEAFAITGNAEERHPKTRISNIGRAQGVVKFWDDTNGEYIPLDGIYVYSISRYETFKTQVKSDGTFMADDTHLGPFYYRLEWSSYDFKIEAGETGRVASISTSETMEPWKLLMNHQSKNMIKENNIFYSQVFRPAYAYYYKDIMNLERPQVYTGATPRKLRLFVYSIKKLNSDGSFEYYACANDGQHGGLCYNNSDLDKSYIHIHWFFLGCDVYEVTIHELAHSAHYRMVGSMMSNTELIIKESWAKGVAECLGSAAYGYPIYSDGIRGSYTDVLIDLMNGANKKVVTYHYNNKYSWEKESIASRREYVDNVSGYTIRELQDALKSATIEAKSAKTTMKWNMWCNKIKSMYNNPTEQYVQSTFDYWNNPTPSKYN